MQSTEGMMKYGLSKGQSSKPVHGESDKEVEKRCQENEQTDRN